VISSNIGLVFISHRFCDTTTYPLKRTFLLPPLFNPKFENVSLALNP